MKNKQKVKTTKFFNSNLTTTISISLVLFLVGLITVLSLLANELTSFVKENISFTIVLNDQISVQDVHNLEAALKSAPYTKSIEYISKERAIKELATELGENPQNFLGYNPLLASIEVKTHAKYANAKNMDAIEKQIKMLPGVKEFIYQKNMINLVNDNIQTVSVFLLIITILLLFIAIGLINNTIRLQIYSKRFTINTMKLVGATSWFIRKPFLAKSIINGVVASVISSILLGALLYYLQTYQLAMVSLWNIPMILITFGTMLFMGIVISFLSSLFAVGKYLRFKTNDLYYI
jgi:cell division transport system permease protein